MALTPVPRGAPGSAAPCSSGRVQGQSPRDSSVVCSPSASPVEFGGGPAGWHPRPGPAAGALGRLVCSGPEAGPPGALGRAWTRLPAGHGPPASVSPSPLERDAGRWYSRGQRASSGPSRGPGVAAVARVTLGACAGRTGACGPQGHVCSACVFTSGRWFLCSSYLWGGEWAEWAGTVAKPGQASRAGCGSGAHSPWASGGGLPHPTGAGRGRGSSCLPPLPHGATVPWDVAPLCPVPRADLSRPAGGHLASGFLRVDLGLQLGCPGCGTSFSLACGHFRAQQRGALWTP